MQTLSKKENKWQKLVEIREMKNSKQSKTSKIKIWSFDKINKIDKTLAIVTKEKKWKHKSLSEIRWNHHYYWIDCKIVKCTIKSIPTNLIIYIQCPNFLKDANSRNTQGEIDNLVNPISVKEIGTTINDLPKVNQQVQMVAQVNSTEHSGKQ